ncbi:amino acid transporter [Macrolepiota fuliginosa MF-IS2]|uniref:Amino acid transporter n=1 Tax=Macrolepiota fuliginosa MF-IS2 TaxID=1400762 RepID=A0A9P5X8V2_9AGAR|nr:amino acid transporter [Macrolepiota fuliginosa MF-IS2]
MAERLEDKRHEANRLVRAHIRDNALLAKLGYRGEFQRDFSPLSAIGFAFSIMGVSASVASIFVFPLVTGEPSRRFMPQIMPEETLYVIAGHLGMIFGWIIPCLFVVTVALSLAELTSAMPTSAGLYYFSAKLVPSEWVPLVCWITGWANVTGQILLVSSIEFTNAQLITTGIAVASDGKTLLGPAPTFGIILALLFSHSIVCPANSRILARLSLLTGFINVATAISTAIALIVVSGPNRTPARDAFLLLENHTDWNNGWAFIMSFTGAMWTLTGYDASAHISEEISSASRTAPLAMLSGVIGTEVIGFILFIGLSFASPDITSIVNTNLSMPMGQVLLDNFGKKGMLAVWSLCITVQWVNGVTQGVDASRVTFALARDNGLPGSRWWKQVHPFTKTPVYATWLVMSLSAILAVLVWSNTALSSLAGATVVGLYTSYAIPIFLRITFGHKTFKPGPFNLGRWSRPIGTIAVVWALFASIILSFPLKSHLTSPNDMNYTVVIISGVFFLSSLSWILSARKWFRGPVPNITGDEVEKVTALESERDDETGAVSNEKQSLDTSLDKISG